VLFPLWSCDPGGSAKKIITFICRLSRNLGASTLAKLKALSRPVNELLQFNNCIVYIALRVKCPKLQDIMIHFEWKMLYQHAWLSTVTSLRTLEWIEIPHDALWCQLWWTNFAVTPICGKHCSVVIVFSRHAESSTRNGEGPF